MRFGRSWRALAARGGLAALVILALPAAAAPSPCDPESGTWCDRAGASCTSQLPGPGLTGCDVRVTDQWSFNEAAYCSGCVYTFYVLVECGREMHLPLTDMEGAEITVTEVLSGRPATLRCLNDAAKGNPPQVIRCVGPGGRTGYGPPYDQSVTTPGSLSWGFPDCVSAPDLTCDDVPVGGGTVDRVSPGELQTMDCYVESPAGLCGLYRIDVRSGGFEWKLFANCDGSPAPQFQIFFDCAEALAQFNPRPELALADLTASGNCPAVEARFQVQNLGCADYDGTIPVRITTDCVPPQVIDLDVPGPLPANGSIPVSVPLSLTCDATVTVTIDPANTIVECTEASSVASCAQASGVRSLQALVECCAATLQPRVSDVAGCAGDPLVLDGASSTIDPCGSPLYRWSDASGNIVQDWSPVPTLAVQAECPDDVAYTLEVACDGEPCRQPATAWVRCVAPSSNAGPNVAACGGTRVALDGSASSVPGCAAPEHRWLFGGTTVRDWSPDPTYVLDPFDCAQAGVYTLETRCAGLSCADADDVTVTCAAGSAPAEASWLRLSRSGTSLTLTWSPMSGIDGFRVLRGSIDSLWIARAYDHAADDAAGAGACDAGLAATWTDPDDAARDGARRYYLVAPFTACGGDGPTGFGRIHASRPPRPPRLPTASCP